MTRTPLQVRKVLPLLSVSQEGNPCLSPALLHCPQVQSRTRAGSTSSLPAATTGTSSCRPRAGSCCPGRMTGRASWKASAGSSAQRGCSSHCQERIHGQGMPFPGGSERPHPGRGTRGAVTTRAAFVSCRAAAAAPRVWKIALQLRL